jgi:Lon protease-like protein
MSPDLIGFDGTARLFPLPNLVLFPHVVQPLHIFEPRYRQMTADALAADRLLTLVLLKPGHEAEYEQRPPIHDVACVGKVLGEQKLEDGRYNLLLRGVSRARIVKEVPSVKLYRLARVELVADRNVPPAARAGKLRRKLAELAPAWFPQQEELLEQLSRLFASDLDLGALCDIFSFALPLDIEFKQELLATPAVDRRARRLLEHLEEHKPQPPPPRRFPPEFSDN